MYAVSLAKQRIPVYRDLSTSNNEYMYILILIQVFCQFYSDAHNQVPSKVLYSSQEGYTYNMGAGKT